MTEAEATAASSTSGGGRALTRTVTSTATAAATTATTGSSATAAAATATKETSSPKKKAAPAKKKKAEEKAAAVEDEQQQQQPQPSKRIPRKDRIQQAHVSGSVHNNNNNEDTEAEVAEAPPPTTTPPSTAESEASDSRNARMMMMNSSHNSICSLNGSQRRLAVYVSSEELSQSLHLTLPNNIGPESSEEEEEEIDLLGPPQPPASSSPTSRRSSHEENPQDPPTLDASESAALDFRTATAGDDGGDSGDDGDNNSSELSDPFLAFKDNNNGLGDPEERLQAKIENFISLRTAGSPFFQANPPTPLPVFNTDEIKLGMLLGQGEFGTVCEVVEISDKGGHQELPKLLRRLSTQNANTIPHQHHHNRQASMDVAFMANSSIGVERVRNRQPSVGLDAMYEHDDHYEVVHDDNDDVSEASIEIEDIQKAQRARKVLKKRCWREGKARYAVKRLRDDLLDFVRDDSADYDHQHRTIGAMDLAMEAKLLASFNHPNICKLRGLAGVPGSPDFSLILDRLYMTLDEKIDEWRDELKRTNRVLRVLSCKGVISKCFGTGLKREQLSSREIMAMDTIRSKTSNPLKFGQSKLAFQREQLLHRLYAAFDVARALRHLHQHSLLYRDLKPQNIAYDIRGDIRVFDFGLCKELVDRDLLQAPDDYNATGMTGSRRWMAPEVYLCAPYGLSADVFSFGLLLWNLCSLKVPFGNRLTCESHHERVIVKGERPKRLWSTLVSDSLWNMMTCCWSVTRAKRPSFEEVCALLRSEIMALREEIENARMLRNNTNPQSSSAARIPAPPSVTPSDKHDTATVDNSTELQEKQNVLMRSGTADTVRKSNVSTEPPISSSGGETEHKKGFFDRWNNKNKNNRRKQFKKSKYDAVNASCHFKGRLKQAQFRNRHNNNSLKQRASRLLHIRRSMSLRRSSLENRSLYLLDKSDRSLDDLQISSENINFSMRQLHLIHSLEDSNDSPLSNNR